jgi:hypothetical protein
MLGAAVCFALGLGTLLLTAPATAQGPAPSTEADRSTAQPPASSDLDTNYWILVRDSTDPEALQSYLHSFPTGKFADIARQRLVTLREQQNKSAMVTPGPSSDVPRYVEPTKVGPASPSLLPQTAPPADNIALARTLQRELKRVGCLDGEADGVWGDQSRAALNRFARHANVSLAGDDPNVGVLDSVTARQARVCPLVCNDDQKVVGDRCVSVTPPRRARQEPAAERREPKRAWAERPAAEPREPRGNPNSGKKLCFGGARNELVACP